MLLTRYLLKSLLGKQEPYPLQANLLTDLELFLLKGVIIRPLSRAASVLFSD